MKILRFAVIAFFLTLVGAVAFASPLAAAAPAAAAVVSGGIVWGGLLLISEIRANQFCALSAASALKLDVILRNGIRALKKRLSPVLAFSTVMRSQVLTETNKVQVPFYALETLTSKDFDGSYSFVGADGTVAAREVEVNKRKYQPLEFTSKELRRNSAVDLNMVMMLKIEKLAEDVLNDIASVITNANFGAAIFTGAASGFDRTDVSGIRTDLSQVNWPHAGRSLVLESDYEGALVNDIITVATDGGDNVRREGSVGRLLGFDIFEHPNMPGNGENLVGYTALPYAILAAFSPIEPAEEVKDNLSDYRIITDPDTGLSLEYRSWGDPNSDTARRVIEVNYGYAKGDAAQLKRLVSA